VDENFEDEMITLADGEIEEYYDINGVVVDVGDLVIYANTHDRRQYLVSDIHHAQGKVRIVDTATDSGHLEDSDDLLIIGKTSRVFSRMLHNYARTATIITTGY
jgi:hypothetical protein